MVKAFFPKAKKLVNVAAMNNETRQADDETGARDSVSESSVPAADIPGAAPGKALSAEAIRALQEAEARRKAAPVPALAPEINGRREGGEPTRYGDWEKKGLAVDF